MGSSRRDDRSLVSRPVRFAASRNRAPAALLGALVLLALACTSKQPSTLLIKAEEIYTLDSAFRTAEAMTIHEGKVQATGQMSDLLRRYQPDSIIDASGAYMYPGWNDAHAHFLAYAQMKRQAQLRGTNSYGEVLERLQELARSYDLPYLNGHGWDQNNWPQQQFPHRDRLDSLFPHTPVRLSRIDGHAVLVNGAALRQAGVPEDTSVAGGKLLRDDQGRLTGVLIDRAMELVKAPELPRDLLVQAILEAQRRLHAVGITSLTEAGLPRSSIELIDSLQQAGALRLRINAMVADDSSSLAYFLERGPLETELLRVHSAKFYWDGALGSRGALLLEPYADQPHHYGMQLYSDEHYRYWAQRLAQEGWQMAIHAIGDSANRSVIRLAEKLLDTIPDHRWRVEHAQVVHPRDRQRMAQAGLVPSVQPTHAISDRDWAGDRLGEREAHAYSYADLLQGAGFLPLGTDFPIEAIDPLRTYGAAVFRQDSAGLPPEGYQPSQAISVEEALRGMTHWPARAAFQESSQGRLVAGHRADFVIYSRDLTKLPRQALSALRPEATFLGGEQVYRRAE